MGGIFNCSIFLVVVVNCVLDIEVLLWLVDVYGICLVVVGGGEVWMMVKELVK